MCGRYSRSRPGLDYIEPLMTDLGQYEPLDFPQHWNVAPSTMQPVIYPDGPRVIRWGYRPSWAVERKIPQMFNARLDKAGTSMWKALWKAGRVIVPADGWYEWVMEEGKKQPYYIRPADGAPLYFAGLSSVKPGSDAHEGDGFVIVTGAADAGLLDVHDRKPLVFSADVAREWLDPTTTFEMASHLANNTMTPAESFIWFRVSPAVNRVGNDEPSLNDPI